MPSIYSFLFFILTLSAYQTTCWSADDTLEKTLNWGRVASEDQERLQRILKGIQSTDPSIRGRALDSLADPLNPVMMTKEVIRALSKSLSKEKGMDGVEEWPVSVVGRVLQNLVGRAPDIDTKDLTDLERSINQLRRQNKIAMNIGDGVDELSKGMMTLSRLLSSRGMAPSPESVSSLAYAYGFTNPAGRGLSEKKENAAGLFPNDQSLGDTLFGVDTKKIDISKLVQLVKSYEDDDYTDQVLSQAASQLGKVADKDVARSGIIEALSRADLNEPARTSLVAALLGNLQEAGALGMPQNMEYNEVLKALEKELLRQNKRMEEGDNLLDEAQVIEALFRIIGKMNLDGSNKMRAYAERFLAEMLPIGMALTSPGLRSRHDAGFGAGTEEVMPVKVVVMTEMKRLIDRLGFSDQYIRLLIQLQIEKEGKARKAKEDGLGQRNPRKSRVGRHT